MAYVLWYLYHGMAYFVNRYERPNYKLEQFYLQLLLPTRILNSTNKFIRLQYNQRKLRQTVGGWR